MPEKNDGTVTLCPPGHIYKSEVPFTPSHFLPAHSPGPPSLPFLHTPWVLTPSLPNSSGISQLSVYAIDAPLKNSKPPYIHCMPTLPRLDQPPILVDYRPRGSKFNRILCYSNHVSFTSCCRVRGGKIRLADWRSNDSPRGEPSALMQSAEDRTL